MTNENQETQDEGLKFPIVHDACPVCGRARPITQIVRDEEAAKGRVPKDLPVAAINAVAPVTEMKTILLGLSIVPVLTHQLDVCECGAVYAVNSVRQDMPTGDLQKVMGIVRQPQQPPPGFPGQNRQQRRHM